MHALPTLPPSPLTSLRYSVPASLSVPCPPSAVSKGWRSGRPQERRGPLRLDTSLKGGCLRFGEVTMDTVLSHAFSSFQLIRKFSSFQLQTGHLRVLNQQPETRLC